MKTIKWCLRLSCLLQVASLIIFIVLSIASDSLFHDCLIEMDWVKELIVYLGIPSYFFVSNDLYPIWVELYLWWRFCINARSVYNMKHWRICIIAKLVKNCCVLQSRVSWVLLTITIVQSALILLQQQNWNNMDTGEDESLNDENRCFSCFLCPMCNSQLCGLVDETTSSWEWTCFGCSWKSSLNAPTLLELKCLNVS